MLGWLIPDLVNPIIIYFILCLGLNASVCVRSESNMLFNYVVKVGSIGEGMSEYVWWLEQALRDLRKAENSVRTEDYDAVAFWAHQAVEKALKALLLSRGCVARGHSLLELARKVRDELGIDVDQVLDDLRELNPHYIISRYPNAANAPPHQLYTRDKALDLLSRARRVLEWVRQYLR